MINKNTQLLKMLIVEYNGSRRYNELNRSIVLNSDLFPKYKMEAQDALLLFSEKIEGNVYINEQHQVKFFRALEIIDDRLSRRVCNDFILPDDWGNFEKQEYHREFNEFNGSLDVFYDELSDNIDFSYTQDFSVCFYLKHKFKTYFEKEQLAIKIKDF